MKKRLKFSIVLVALLILVIGLVACGKDIKQKDNIPISGQTLSYSVFDVEGYLNESILTIDKNNNFKYEDYESQGYEKSGMIITGKAINNDSFLDNRLSNSSETDFLLAEIKKYGLEESDMKEMWKDRIWLVIEKSFYNEYLFGLLNHTEDYSDNFEEGEAFFYIDKVNDNFYFFHDTPLFISGNKGSQHTIVTIFGNSHFTGYGVDIVYDISSDEDDIDLGFSIVYADGSTKDLELTVDDIKGLDKSTTGFQKVSIEYQNKDYPLTALIMDSDKIDLEDFAYIWSSFESRIEKETTLEDFIANEDNEIGYRFGEDYKYIPLSDEEVKITGFEATKTGKRQLTIEYKGATIKVVITVYDPKNLKIEELDIDYEEFVKKGEEIELFGAYIDYDDGTDEYVDFEDGNITCTGFKKNSLGAQLVSFTYEGQTVQRAVWVYEEGKEPLTDIEVVDGDGDSIYYAKESDITKLYLQLYDLNEEELGDPIAITTSMIEYVYDYSDEKVAIIKYEKDGFIFTATIRIITED